MNKKLSIIVALVVLSVIGARAQKFSGRWYHYPTVSHSISNVVDTGSKVYFITGNNLYHYSEADNETFGYSNSLSDVGVTGVYYNSEAKKLLITYLNYNMDIVSEDGSVLNVSSLRDAVLTTTKTVRAVDFRGNKAYIATDFGFIILDMETGRVDRSGIFGFPVDGIMALGDDLMIYLGATNAAGCTSNTFYTAPMDGKISNISAFTPIFTLEYSSFTRTDDDHFLAVTKDKWRTHYHTFDHQTKSLRKNGETVVYDIVLKDVNNRTFRGADGKFYTSGNSGIYTFNPETPKFDNTALPAAIAKMQYGVGRDGLQSLWVGTPDGLAKWNLSTNEVLMQPFLPDGVSVAYPHLLRWDSLGRLWVSNLCGGVLYSNAGQPHGVGSLKYVNVVDGDKIEDKTPLTDATSERMALGTTKFHDYTDEEIAQMQSQKGQSTWVNGNKTNSGTKYLQGGHKVVLPDPDNPELFWIPSYDGLYLCKKGEGWSAENPNGDVLNIYSRVNSPYPQTVKGPVTYMQHAEFDPEGNLWVAFLHTPHSGMGPDIPFIILPSKIRKERPADVKYEDWIEHPGNGSQNFSYNVNMAFCRKSDMLYVTDAAYRSVFFAVDTKGTYTDTSDDVMIAHTSFQDQDSNPVSPLYYTGVMEDAEGRVWFCHTAGVFYLPDGKLGAQTGLSVRRPVVPRNDGTIYGDYLLDGVNISGIGIDSTDRKWFTTFDSGVYLVNADGTKILAHYTKDNSPLVSNVIYSVACDPNSNKVYFGTDLGLMMFESDASPAQEDFSDVYVYPNPVRPDYNGWITVAGLMDNSLVKIADMSGNVIAQGRSAGGSFIWDGCNSAGARVRTGVYLVLASSGDDSGKSDAVVSKIMIMN